MYYLVLFIHQNIEGKEYAQSTTRYEDIVSATTEWHTACASYRNKETTLEFTACVMNSIGQAMTGLRDHYEVVTETAEGTVAE